MEKKPTEEEQTAVTISDEKEDKSSKSTLDDLNLLTKLFPKVDKTSLIDSLLACNGDTVAAIQKLLSSAASSATSKEEPEEKKRPPTPPPIKEYSPKPEPETKLPMTNVNPRNVYNSAQQRYMAAAAAVAAVSGNNPPPASAGANGHQYANPGFSAFLPNAWFRPELAQYLNSTRSFLGHPGFAQPYFLSRMANAGSKFGRSTLSPPPLTPLHHSYGSILSTPDEKFGKSSGSSITGDGDINTLSPAHSE